MLNSFIYLQAKSGLKAWDPFALLPQLVTIFIVTFLIMWICIAYNKSLKLSSTSQAPRGIVLVVELFIKWIERQVIELMGTKYKCLTVYVIYILLFVGIGNLMSVIGFESIVTSYTVPLSLGLVTFGGIYYFAFKYQKLMFFKKFLVNPLDLIQQFVPLISISFRLFGNILGGSIIILLVTTLLNNIWGKIPIFGPVDLLAGVFLPFLSIYFDIFDGLIQSYIFAMLTITYWAMEMQHGNDNHKEERKETVSITLREDQLLKNNLKKRG